MNTERKITFNAGQKVRTIYGHIGTVLCQCGPNNCMVMLIGHPGWWHPSKLFPI